MEKIKIRWVIGGEDGETKDRVLRVEEQVFLMRNPCGGRENAEGRVTSGTGVSQLD